MSWSRATLVRSHRYWRYRPNPELSKRCQASNPDGRCPGFGQTPNPDRSPAMLIACSKGSGRRQLSNRAKGRVQFNPDARQRRGTPSGIRSPASSTSCIAVLTLNGTDPSGNPTLVCGVWADETGLQRGHALAQCLWPKPLSPPVQPLPSPKPPLFTPNCQVVPILPNCDCSTRLFFPMEGPDGVRL